MYASSNFGTLHDWAGPLPIPEDFPLCLKKFPPTNGLQEKKEHYLRLLRQIGMGSEQIQLAEAGWDTAINSAREIAERTANAMGT